MKKALTIAAMVAVIGMAGLAYADTIDIVSGTVDPGPARTAGGSEFWRCYDGNTGTFTYMTNSFTTGTPQHTRLGFAGAAELLERIRINDVFNNDGNGPVTYTLRYTTDTNADLNARVYTNVTSLDVLADMAGDTMPNVAEFPATATVQHLDALHDGYYSVTFDGVADATGFELEWNNTGGYKHWQVREFEGHGAPPPPPPVIPHAGNEVDMPDWRTTDVVKTLDPDGDNIYGTDGWIRPSGTLRPADPKLDPDYCTVSYIGLPGWNYWSTGGVHPDGWTGWRTGAVDDAVLSGPGPIAGVEAGRQEKGGAANDMVQIDVTEDGSFRVGVMTDFIVAYAGYGVVAGPTSVRVRKTTGDLDDSGMIAVPVRNAVADWMFFDIIGAVAGDQFIISAASTTNPWAYTQISHISFDTITAEEPPVPEPAGLGLLGVALLAMRRKRRAL